VLLATAAFIGTHRARWPRFTAGSACRAWRLCWL